MKTVDTGKAIKWKEIPFAELNEKFTIKNATDNYFSDEDFFPDEPRTFYYKGDIHLKANVEFSGVDDDDDYAYYIIDGNVKIDGYLSINVLDIYSILGITGSLEANNLLLGWEAFLYVQKTTSINHIMYNYLSDGGGAYFKENTETKVLISNNYGGISFGKNCKFKGLELNKEDMIETYQDMEFHDIEKLVSKGKTIYKTVPG